jgi:hypothetical protein
MTDGPEATTEPKEIKAVPESPFEFIKTSLSSNPNLEPTVIKQAEKALEDAHYKFTHAVGYTSKEYEKGIYGPENTNLSSNPETLIGKILNHDPRAKEVTIPYRQSGHAQTDEIIARSRSYFLGQALSSLKMLPDGVDPKTLEAAIESAETVKCDMADFDFEEQKAVKSGTIKVLHLYQGEQMKSATAVGFANIDEGLSTAISVKYWGKEGDTSPHTMPRADSMIIRVSAEKLVELAQNELKAV